MPHITVPNEPISLTQTTHLYLASSSRYVPNMLRKFPVCQNNTARATLCDPALRTVNTAAECGAHDDWSDPFLLTFMPLIVNFGCMWTQNGCQVSVRGLTGAGEGQGRLFEHLLRVHQHRSQFPRSSSSCVCVRVILSV